MYWKLLFGPYSLIPLIVLLGTYASLSLVFQADGWRTAAVSAAVFSFLVYFGARLIDLSIWWRQIQRLKSRTFWETRRPSEPERRSRERAASVFRVLVAAVPLVCAALATETAREFTSLVSEVHGTALWRSPLPPCSLESCPVRLLVVLAVFAAVSLAVASRRVPSAYRVSADDPKHRLKLETALAAAGALSTIVLLALLASRFACPSLPVPASDCAGQAAPIAWLGQAALFAVIATLVYTYRLYRFVVVKGALCRSRPQEIIFEDYAGDPPCVADA